MKYIKKDRLVQKALQEIMENQYEWKDWIQGVIENELKRHTREQLMEIAGYFKE